MVTEDMKNIVVGPPLERLTDSSLGELLLLLLKTHDNLVLEVDASTGEELPAIILLKRAIKLAKWLKKRRHRHWNSCVIPVATFLAGATFAPLNPDYAPYTSSMELKHVLGLSKPKIIFCSDRKPLIKWRVFCPRHPFIRKLRTVWKRPVETPKCSHVRRYYTSEEIDDDFEATPLDPKEAVATILCSSGTTGMPKGVMCTHDNMTACIDSLRVSANELADSVEPNEALIGLVPFFHSFGFMMMFLNLLGGKKIVVMSRFNSKELPGCINFQINCSTTDTGISFETPVGKTVRSVFYKGDA
ncbi:hypothetical protein NQ317_010160 [Molorchus minor]|uniref:AMP-dependent synthetase/ligase domain-containing protein n=1 Tax=Molorchus minor TaxID=1323400 RepID=A0ABQ9JG50_9CUCU|nr:hypothetical protein NQ317_010160 [Molorchus minor]